MQLVAYGAQDIYLTGNPQITFFKVVYRRHTNFSIESIQQTFNGTADFGNRVTCVISRNGDLIYKMLLQATLPALTSSGNTVAWTSHVGHHLLDYVEVEIGGQTIDKHYGTWLQIWYELTISAEHQDGYNEMIGHTATNTTLAGTISSNNIYVPLQFWFNRNPGLALPLIALQYHEVRVNIKFRNLNELCVVDSDDSAPDSSPTFPSGGLSNVSLYVDYIYLDTDERRRFAQVSHEYLIEQLQYTGSEAVGSNESSSNVRLNFNHPVKELAWVCQLDSNVSGSYNQHSNYTQTKDPYNTGTPDYTGGSNPISTAKLLLNGHDRYTVRNGDYFNKVQPYQHHTRIPSSPGVNVYSFGLKPEEHQPSGTCNMSRIDNATLQLEFASTFGAGQVYVYAVSYNVLRVMGGMGGLAYSN